MLTALQWKFCCKSILRSSMIVIVAVIVAVVYGKIFLPDLIEALPSEAPAAELLLSISVMGALLSSMGSVPLFKNAIAYGATRKQAAIIAVFNQLCLLILCCLVRITVAAIPAKAGSFKLFSVSMALSELFLYVAVSCLCEILMIRHRKSAPVIGIVVSFAEIFYVMLCLGNGWEECFFSQDSLVIMMICMASATTAFVAEMKSMRKADIR